jgi:hypothetical protein
MKAETNSENNTESPPWGVVGVLFGGRYIDNKTQSLLRVLGC